MGTVFPWVGKESHHIKEGGWLCVNKTWLLLNILKHDLKSDLQLCCQETEEVSCLFYKLPMFSPLPACSSLTESRVMDGRRCPCSQKPLQQRVGQAVTSTYHLCQDKELQNTLGAKGPWLAPHSAQSHRYPCSLGHICYTHGPLMTFISCVSDNVALLVEWQCSSTGQQTALAGKCLPPSAGSSSAGLLQRDALLWQIKHQAGYQPMNRGHRLSGEKGKKLPWSEHMKAWKLSGFLDER